MVEYGWLMVGSWAGEDIGRIADEVEVAGEGIG